MLKYAEDLSVGDEIQAALVNGPKAHWENPDLGSKKLGSFGLGSGLVS